jgi:hypothetical protein
MTRPSARSRDEERAHTNGIVCALESASEELRALHKRRVIAGIKGLKALEVLFGAVQKHFTG